MKGSKKKKSRQLDEDFIASLLSLPLAVVLMMDVARVEAHHRTRDAEGCCGHAAVDGEYQDDVASS